MTFMNGPIRGRFFLRRCKMKFGGILDQELAQDFIISDVLILKSARDHSVHKAIEAFGRLRFQTNQNRPEISR